MGLIEDIKESFRKELSVDQEVVEREKKSDKNRKEWLLWHVSLYKGDLKEYINNEGYAYFPTEKSRQPKKIKVGIKRRSNEQIAISKLEEKLKFEIHYRNCNLGVNYRKYEEGRYLVGEATPARRG